MWADFIDALRKNLHRLTSIVGEEHGNKPNSKKKNRLAQASLDCDIPTLASILPYESVDNDLIFRNKNSMGFGLHVMPANGADEDLFQSLSQLLKTKITDGIDCTVLLYRNAFVESALEHGFSALRGLGGHFETLGEKGFEFHKKAAISGYPNRRNINAPLSDYRVYFFFSTELHDGASELLCKLRQAIESELKVMGLPNLRVKKRDFLILIKALILPNLNHLDWPEVDEEDSDALSAQILSGNSIIKIQDLNLEVEGTDAEGKYYQTKIINCHIKKFPKTEKEFALWETPNLFANLLRPEHGIPCSFLISFTIRGQDPEKMISKAKSRANSLNSNAKPVQNFLNPRAKDERAAWNYIYDEGSRDNLSLFPTFYNVILFTTKEQESEAIAKTIGAYRYLGFELQQSIATQWIRFLGSLPFFMTEGFFNDFEAMGLTKIMTHYNIANLLPIVADSKGSSKGMLLPTHRNQLFFLDLFDNKSLPITNYNFMTVGSSGAGKSMFQQALILSGLALGEITYVVDLGQSYKHLCELVGGIYVDVRTISLNPFALFDFEGSAEVEMDGALVEVDNKIQIRDLFAIMASPHIPLCEVQKSYLLDAIVYCWEQKGRESNVDDLLDRLNTILKESSVFDSRLNDLRILLNKYGSKGIYGSLCKGKPPNFHNAKFVVFEMGGLKDNPDLLMISIFMMVLLIQGYFYQAPRDLKKRCLFEETWRFLASGGNPIAAQFIEQGYRTARKYNGGFGITTQFLLDTHQTIQGQAIEACSDIKIIMRQGKFNDFVTAYPTRFNKYQQLMIGSFGDVIAEGFSNVMIEAGNSYSFHRYFADSYTRLLFSSSGDEFMAVEECVAKGMSLNDAISELSQKLYGENA